MKITFLISILFLSTELWAQSVSCFPRSDGYYSKLELIKPELPFEASWYTARLENKYKQRKIFTVDPVLRNETLSFLSKERPADFALKVLNFAGSGTYRSVELILNQRSSAEEKTGFMCDFPVDIIFSNACEPSDQNLILFQAAENRNFLGLESALECGASGNARNEFGCTSLLLVADPFCGQSLPSPLPYNPVAEALPIVDLLTNNGAMVDAKDPVNDERALHKFAKLGDFDVVSTLLDLDAEVDAQDKDGFTPLMRAVEKNDKFMVERFIEAAPELHLKNKNGETALMISQRFGYKKLELLLQEPSKTIEITGQSDGSCTPSRFQIAPNKLAKVVLKASADKMFLLTSSGLGLNLMADAGASVSQNIMPKQHGSFEFTCGVHGAAKQTTGEISVH